MHRLTLAAFAAALLAAPSAAAATLPQPIAAAAANPARETDARSDVRRKGPELLAFAEVKPGQKVYDLIPGSGYFTRLFSLTVGPSGRVYAVWPQAYDKVSQPHSPNLRKTAAKAPFTNVRVMVQPARALSTPEPLDLVFTSQNDHDYPDEFMGPADLTLLNRRVFAALEPGGLFVIVDHRGRPGTGTRETDTLHRIDTASSS